MLPADLLTKALGVAKFQSLLPFCGIHVPKPAVCKLTPQPVRVLSWKTLGVLLLALCAFQLVKGQDSEVSSDDGSTWLIFLAIGVILAWEGFKSASAACVRSLRCGRRAANLPTPGVACQTDPQAPPPLSPARVVQVPQPIPVGLEAYFTSTGERWYQDYHCGDIRNRIARRFLPCEHCTANHLMLQPPDQPIPLAQQVPPPPQVRRRRPRG